MKCLRLKVSDITYIVYLLLDGEGSLFLHSSWRFYPGRTLGELTTPSALPWELRQAINELLEEPI